MLLPFGKGHAEHGPGLSLQLPGSAKLPGKDFHNPKPQGFVLAGHEVLRYADSVVDHRQLHSALVASSVNPDGSATAPGKRVLECIGDQLVQNQPGGNSLIDSQNQRNSIGP